jgi:hypothetical protein
MNEFRHWLQGELHEIHQKLGTFQKTERSSLQTYTLRNRETDLLSALAVLDLYQHETGVSGL